MPYYPSKLEKLAVLVSVADEATPMAEAAEAKYESPVITIVLEVIAKMIEEDAETVALAATEEDARAVRRKVERRRWKRVILRQRSTNQTRIP